MYCGQSGYFLNEPRVCVCVCVCVCVYIYIYIGWLCGTFGGTGEVNLEFWWKI